MFGYVRPLQGELKVRELERFKACYCGLCHALGKNYGLPARFILSYELVFLSMLLWDPDEAPVIRRKLCIASPCRKKRYCACNRTLETCAGYTVILTWWRLRDTIADEKFHRTIPHRLACFVLSGAYRKAARDFPEFDYTVRDELVSLSEYEQDVESSLDGAADKFARILSAITPESDPEAFRRPLLEFMYHLGRWIYLIDACDDYKDDIKNASYNPVAARYPPVDGKIPEDGLTRLKTTITHSNNLLCLAFELLPENTWADIVRNMIYLGMPDVCERVLIRASAQGIGDRE